MSSVGAPGVNDLGDRRARFSSGMSSAGIVAPDGDAATSVGSLLAQHRRRSSGRRVM